MKVNYKTFLRQINTAHISQPYGSTSHTPDEMAIYKIFQYREEG